MAFVLNYGWYSSTALSFNLDYMDVTAYKFDVYIEMNIKYLCQYYFE